MLKQLQNSSLIIVNTIILGILYFSIGSTEYSINVVFGNMPQSGSVQLVQLLSHVRLFVTPWTAAYQASLSITHSLSLLKLMSIELMPSKRLILCHSLLLLLSIFSSIRVFSNESVLRIRWPKN